jgi:RHS repeat-associated protein
VKNLAILAEIDTQRQQISDTLRIFEERVGAKNYELSNHLGNVLATISDKTIFNTDHYNGIVYSAQLYYPFGWEIPTLSYTAKKYRFGFNGKEDDREWHAQDYGFRLYTPREARFISVDPITAEYPELTPYQFAGNTPIEAVDLDGLEPLHLSVTEYKNHASQTYEYQQTYDGYTHQIMMMKVDDWWVFKRMEGDNDQWYYLDNQNQQWHKFSNDKNYADDLREVVINYAILPSLTLAGGTALRLGRFTRQSFHTIRYAFRKKNKKATPQKRNENLDHGKYAKNGIPGSAEKIRTDLNIPKDWVLSRSNKDGGIRFADPKNTASNHIRVMPGKKDHPDISSRNPYVKEVRDGALRDKNGAKIPNPTGKNQNRSPESHISLDVYRYKNPGQ